MQTQLDRSPAQTVSDIDRIHAMDTAELRSELASALNLTARQLLWLAAIWAELEKRGEDLDALRSGLAIYLPAIAAGTVVPEAVVKFAGSAKLLRAVTQLPPDEQRRLASGEPVKLVVRQNDQFTHRLMPVHALTMSQVTQVFADRRIRSEVEQIALLTPISRPQSAKTVRHGSCRADRDRGIVKIGNRVVQPSDMLSALADLATPGDDEPGSDSPSVAARLTPAEHQRLKERAAQAGTTVSAYIRKSLRAVGGI